MKFLFDNIPLAIVIVGICMLMLYPYIGAGLLLAALCFEAEQYVLMVIAFLICILLQSIMGRRIKPYHVPVKPSRASRRKKKAPPKGAHDAGVGGAVRADAGAGASTGTAADAGAAVSEDAKAMNDTEDSKITSGTKDTEDAGNTNEIQETESINTGSSENERVSDGSREQRAQ